MRFGKVLLLFLAAIAAVIVAGCGGGGGGGGASSGVSFFITDGLHNGYDGVWVSVKKVELLSANGAQTVYENAEGKVINVRALNVGGEKRFAFVGEDKVPSGEYVGVRVTVGSKVVLFPTGSANGLEREFSGLDGSGNKQLTAEFGAPKAINGSGDVVIDFKLDDWTDDGTFVHNAGIVEGPSEELNDPTCHEEAHFKGTVSSLTGEAPNQAFVLNSEHGVKMKVFTDEATAIFNANGDPNPALGNNKRVEVRGKFIPGERGILAASIAIRESESSGGPHMVAGPTSDIEPELNRFQVHIREAEGFVPGADQITVQTTFTGTRYFSAGGVSISMAEFFETLLENPEMAVEAHGTVTGEGQDAVLNATTVKLLAGEEPHGAYAKGSVTEKNGELHSFTMSLSRWEGFSGEEGMPVQVQTTGETDFRGPEGEKMSKGAFFELLQVGNQVEVNGVFEGGVLHAERVRMLTQSDLDFARGSVLSCDAENNRFDIVLTAWEGFDGQAGMTVHVQVGENTTFKWTDGESLTRSQFFGKLEVGSIVAVDGQFNGSNSTMEAVKARFVD
jgi:hypothetical protein